MTAWLLMILGISSRTLQSDSSIALSVAKAHVIRSLVLAKSHQMPRRTYLRKSVGVGGGARFRPEARHRVRQAFNIQSSELERRALNAEWLQESC